MSTVHDAALSYATRGWYIFPCGPDKTPMTAHGFKDATCDPDQVKQWWLKYPGAAIGVDCGRSGLVAIDLDHKNGRDGITEWKNLHIETMGALISLTPSGGKHLIFGESRAQIKCSTGKLASGIDIKGSGGYIILPPSKVESGEYSTEGDWSKPPAPIPSELFFLLTEPIKPITQNNKYSVVNPDAGNHWLSKALERAAIGTRNDTGCWLAEQLRDAGLSQSEAEPLMIEYACGVPQFLTDAYTEDEAVATLKSVYTRPAREPAHIPMEQPQPPENFAETDTTILAPKTTAVTRRWSVADLLNTEFPEPKWVVPNKIAEGFSILAGRPKKGKTWLALQIAHAKSVGGNCLGEKVEQGGVLFLALEDSPRRLQARLKKQVIPENANITFVTAWRKFDKGGLDDLLIEIVSGRYSLIIIDSLSRAMGRADQLDLSEMTFICGALQTMAIQNNVSILAIDHHGKSAGFEGNPTDDVIGSTAKAATADTLLGLYREIGKHEATLKIIGREVEEQEIALEWDGFTCTWRSLGDAGTVRAETLKADILRAIRELTEMEELPTTTKIASHLKVNKGSVSKALAEIVVSGQVKRGEKVGRERPYVLQP
jgi:hypothetical protein